MISRITKLSILQTGKLLAVMYAFLALLLVPIMLIVAVVNPKEAAPLVIMIFLYPLMGFIGGLIGALVYNLASRMVGGLEITLEGSTQTPIVIANPYPGTVK
jgi:hypothetical protein